MAKPKKIVLADGTVRWRIVVDAGRDPETNKRRQVTTTYDRQKEALAELARVAHERNKGIYVAPSKLTVGQLLDSWLKSATFEKEEATASNYGHAVAPARLFMGERLAQGITREDAEALRDHMLTAGRRRGGKPGTGVGPRTVRLTIGRLAAAWDQAIDDKKVTSNPFRRVRLPKAQPGTRTSWSADEARAFLAAARDDRLYFAWLMALSGLRREEICGLRWEAVTGETLAISAVRVVVDGRVIEKDAPKSDRGRRVLPLLPGMPEALKSMRAGQAAERLAAGPAYEPGGYVVADELGAGVHPEWLSDEWLRVVKRAGQRRITLHGTRHSANSIMEHLGVPDSIQAAYLGHAVEVNRGTYTHAQPEDMAIAAAALAGAYGLAEGGPA